jgi:hypothetical protein
MKTGPNRAVFSKSAAWIAFYAVDYSKMSSFIKFYSKMGSMKTENLILLGVGGFLAYKMIQKDVNSAVKDVSSGVSSLIPSITFPSITFPNITFPNISLPQTIVVAGTSAATPQNPANTQPSALTPGEPDPFTGAKPDILTGMPTGAQWANNWGEGYAYNFQTTRDPIMSPAPIMSSYTQAPVFGAGKAQIMSPAPIMSAYTPPTGQTAYQAQQASYAAAAIGTPALVPVYTPAYIATLPATGTPGGGTAYQSGNGGYNTGIKYF